MDDKKKLFVPDLSPDEFDEDETHEFVDEFVDEDIDAAAEVKLVLNESDMGMINPRNAFRISWDLGVIFPLLIYLAVILPFRLCFNNDPPLFSAVYWFEFIADLLFILDIFLNFRTGYFVPIVASDAVSTMDEIDDREQDDGNGGPMDSQHTDLVEYDRWRVFQNYLYSWLAIDVFSGIPFALIELLLSGGGGGGDTGSLKSIKSLKMLRFLKLGRLLKVEKILSSLSRDTLDDIEDFIASGSTKTFFLLLKLVLIMSYANHIMACGWVVVGKAGDKAGVNNW